MDYQVTIHYQFKAHSEAEAREKATAYVKAHMTVRRIPEHLISQVQVARACRGFRRKSKEHFCVFYLDTQNRIVGKEIVSVGTLNTSLVHPRECFRTAIQKGCCSVIVAHNHPSGSTEPSPEDLHTTKLLVEAGTLLGIEVLDHVIVTSDSYASLRALHLI